MLRRYRDKLFKTLEMALTPVAYHQQQIVYDLDELLQDDADDVDDTEPVAMKDVVLTRVHWPSDVLNFESRFESGNLRRVYQVDYIYLFIFNSKSIWNIVEMSNSVQLYNTVR